MKTWEDFLVENKDRDVRFRAKGLLTKIITQFPNDLRSMVEEYFQSGKADKNREFSSLLQQLVDMLGAEPTPEIKKGVNSPDLDNVVTPSSADRPGAG